MRRVSQQIGWSQEAKLYYEWLVQLERLTAILGKNIVPTTTTTTTTVFVCTDADIEIGTQTWKLCNLNVDTYRNGDPIPEVTDPTAWAALTTGAWCYYNNDPTYGPIYGKLYNGYAIQDPRGLGPIDYHIPTITELTLLSSYVGDNGGALKEAGTSHWLSPNTGATNSSGWSGLPGGSNNTGYFNIDLATELGFFWSSTESNIPSYLQYMYLIYNDSNTYLGGSVSPGGVGFSVRLIKNKTITLEWSADSSASNWLIENSLDGDVTNVNNWNTVFNLPTLGTPFASVSVPDARHIILSNPGNINTTPFRLFSPIPSLSSNDLISIVDEGVLLHIGDSCFNANIGLASANFAEVVELDADSPFTNCINLATVTMPKLAYTNNGGFEFCTALQSVDFPLLTHIAAGLFYKSGLEAINAPLAQIIDDSAFQQTQLSVANFPEATYVGTYVFSNCPLDTIDLSSCTNLGGTVGDDGVFSGITLRRITLTVPYQLMECNGGNPDGDIQALQNSNIVTVIQV